MKEGTFLRRMHPVLTPKLYFRISMIFYTALSTISAPGANCVPGANTASSATTFIQTILKTRHLFEYFYNLLLVKVKILFFNLPKTRTKSEYLFIFTLELQRKKGLERVKICVKFCCSNVNFIMIMKEFRINYFTIICP